MAKRVQRIRAATAQADIFTGLEGEITVDTTRKAIRVHDGSTEGGFEAGRADVDNVQQATTLQDGKMSKEQVTQLDTASADIVNLQTNTDGQLIKTITGAGPVTLTDEEAENRILIIKDGAPAPTGDPFIILIPNINAMFWVFNLSSVEIIVRSVQQTGGNFGKLGPGGPERLLIIRQGFGGAPDYQVWNITRDDNIDYTGSVVPVTPAVSGAPTVKEALDQGYTDLDARIDANVSAKMDKSANLNDVADKKVSRDNLSLAPIFVGFTMTYGSNTAPSEWEICDGATIGSSASTAALKNNEYEALFTHLWNSYPDAACPVSTGRGATAAADWAANKNIGLPDLRGKSVVGANNTGLPNGADPAFSTRNIGDTGGEEGHALTGDENGPHGHPFKTAASDGSFNSSNTNGNFVMKNTSGTIVGENTGPPVTNAALGGSGQGDPHNTMHPFAVQNYIMYSGVV